MFRFMVVSPVIAIGILSASLCHAQAPAPGQAPPPGYPYGGYQPYYAAPAPAPMLPTRLRYVEGHPIPPGYHLDSRARRGLVISGAVMLGVTYSISASVAASSKRDGDGYLLVPVLGPFVDLGMRGDSSSSSASGERFSLMLDGILQAAGAVLLTVGVAAPERTLERDDAPLASHESRTFAWAVAPRAFGRDGLGVGLGGQF